MAKHPKMIRDYNFVSTGGQFGSKLRLSTFTIHYNKDSDRFYVTDDLDRVQAHRTASVGHASLDAAQRAHQYDDDFRMGR